MEAGTVRGQRRLEFARTVRERSLEFPDARAAWEQAQAEVAESPHYRGFSLEPIEGLVPIGSDPDSGLQEFWHLLSGERPRRDAEGQIRLSQDTGLVLVLVPAGTFSMGSEKELSEQPIHGVKIAPFFLSKYETTQAQWERLSGTNPSYFSAEILTDISPLTDLHTAALHPVERISWTHSRRVLEHHGLDLPTEGQWEYAARGTDGRVFPWGNQQPSCARAVLGDNVALGCGRNTTWPVGSKPAGASAFGLLDMAGNVWEWTDSIYSDSRVVHGGGWYSPWTSK